MCEKQKKSDHFAFDNIFSTQVNNIHIDIRNKKLTELLDFIITKRKFIKNCIQEDFKKPSPEIDFTEIIPIVSELRFVISNIHKWTKPQKNSRTLVHYNSKARVIYQPKGVVLIISPWN